eukprot:TRINITY_DN5834_c0_g1_i6.p1 TRINITY_DN5834_c0_g1~~TRINITY_DN5834_c0_g1_i6.p1  ORF type:complete len:347 (-),score=37.77 TRINITY_DN5834_c0_g1_i6:495-1535(-)
MNAKISFLVSFVLPAFILLRLYFWDTTVHTYNFNNIDHPSPVSRIIVVELPTNPPIKWKDYGQDRVDCNRTVTFIMNRGGFSPRFRCLIGSLRYARISNRTLFFDASRSSYGEWEYFFEPLPSSVCPLPHGERHHTTHENVEDQAHLIEATGACKGEGLPDTPITSSTHLDTLHYASLHLWRFNTQTRSRIGKILSPFTNWTRGFFNAIHVRRGDKNFGPLKEAHYISTEKYVKFLEGIPGFSDVPIFLAADSIATVEEFRAFRPTWKFWYIQDESYNLMRQGNFSTVDFDNSPLDYRLEFSYFFFAEMVMMQYANNLVCTISSNVCSLQHILREKTTIDLPEVLT